VFQMAVDRCFGGDDYAEFGRCYAAAAGFFHFEFGARIESFQGFDQGGGGGSGVQQCADGHVPADAGKCVEIGDSHSLIIGGALVCFDGICRCGVW
jgi:hypothetical protein